MRSGPEAQLTRSVGLGRSLGRRRSQNALEGASRRGVVDLWQIASSQSGRVYSNFNAICCPPPSTLLHCTAQSPRTRFARAVMRSNPNFEPNYPPTGSNRSLFAPYVSAKQFAPPGIPGEPTRSRRHLNCTHLSIKIFSGRIQRRRAPP